MSISTVTSEGLQLKLRELLPSQQGFGTDLSASDTIIPIIDLTQAAEGTTVSELLQTAFAFGSITNFNITNTSTTIISTTGFYRVFGNISARVLTGSSETASFSFSDGATSKDMTVFNFPLTNDNQHETELFDFVVYLNAGESFVGTSSNTPVILNGCTRQIATINGVLVNPVGFTPQ
tara:strand:+ start:680 stop:1213 length:534 start_codon:yes stop_codon:yes gene_type:complete